MTTVRTLTQALFCFSVLLTPTMSITQTHARFRSVTSRLHRLAMPAIPSRAVTVSLQEGCASKGSGPRRLWKVAHSILSQRVKWEKPVLSWSGVQDSGSFGKEQPCKRESRDMKASNLTSRLISCEAQKWSCWLLLSLPTCEIARRILLLSL